MFHFLWQYLVKELSKIFVCQQIFKGSDSEMPDISQYWEISNGSDSFYALVIDKDPFILWYNISSQL